MVVVNSTPLLYLAKIGKLRKIIERFRLVVIPEAVYDEAVRGGMALGKPEAQVIKELIEEGQVKIEKVKKILGEIKGLHKGEVEVLSLAKTRGDEIVVDDKSAYEYAKILGIKALRSIKVMLILLKEKELTFKDLKKNLQLLCQSGFWLTADVYARILEEARAISSAV